MLRQSLLLRRSRASRSAAGRQCQHKAAPIGASKSTGEASSIFEHVARFRRRGGGFARGGGICPRRNGATHDVVGPARWRRAHHDGAAVPPCGGAIVAPRVGRDPR
jgi:hypothetical protein